MILCLEYVLCHNSQFQLCPKKFNSKVIKKIFKYLFDTKSLGLWFPKEISFDLVSYWDVDFIGNQVNRKNTSDNCHCLSYALV